MSLSPGRFFRRLAVLFIGFALTLVFIFPVLIAFMNSIKPLGKILGNVLALPTSLNLNNYIHVFEATNYLRAFGNTLVISLVALGAIIVLGSMCAFKLSRSDNRGSNLILILFSSSMLVPFQTIMLPLVKEASAMHLLDSIPGLILIMVPLFAPFAILVYHGFAKSIPRELDEAAEIDGASQLRTFFQIIFPILRPTTASLVVIYALWAWNDFALPLVMLQSSINKTVTLVTYGYFNSQYMRWDYILAAVSLAAFPVVLFYIFMQRYIIKGITDGAIKG